MTFIIVVTSIVVAVTPFLIKIVPALINSKGKTMDDYRKHY